MQNLAKLVDPFLEFQKCSLSCIINSLKKENCASEDDLVWQSDSFCFPWLELLFQGSHLEAHFGYQGTPDSLDNVENSRHREIC